MTTGQELVLDLSEQMNTIKLPLMALKLDELYRSPDYPGMDKLDFLSALLAPEFRDKVTKTTNNRLRYRKTDRDSLRDRIVRGLFHKALCTARDAGDSEVTAVYRGWAQCLYPRCL